VVSIDEESDFDEGDECIQDYEVVEGCEYIEDGLLHDKMDDYEN
jgi:hypothetical protein